MTFKWTKILLFCISATLINACDNGTEEDYAQMNPQRKTSSSALKKPIILSVDKVGPIDAKTPFNIHHFTVAFEGLNVSQQTSFQEGEAYPIIRITKNGKNLLTVNPNADETGIYSVLIEDNLVENKLGHPLGTQFKSIYSYGKVEKCLAGTEELSGKTICVAPKTHNILYIFAGRWNGPSGEIPPEKVLASWELDAIIWKPIK